MNKLFLFAILVCLALPTTVLALPDSNTIEFSNCTLALPGTNLTANARCGSLDVPENPEDPEGRKINLNIAIAPATGKTTEPDPVFFFAGGPGQAASETWVMIRPTLNKIRKSRDIVMIDQRGTGSSNKLECKSEVEEDLNKELDLELVLLEDHRRITMLRVCLGIRGHELEACLEKLVAHDLGPVTDPRIDPDTDQPDLLVDA